MGPRPRSGQPAARSSSSQASDASWAAAHTGASASAAPSARSDAPASGSISSQPSASSAATTIGTRSGSRCERRWRIAASARKWSQHALNQRTPSDVGTSSTAEMDHTRCVRTGSVRRRPRALRQSSIQASTRSYHPAWNQSGRCRGALPECCASAVPTRAPNGSARSPTGSQAPPATRSGSSPQRQDVEEVGPDGLVRLGQRDRRGSVHAVGHVPGRRPGRVAVVLVGVHEGGQRAVLRPHRPVVDQRDVVGPGPGRRLLVVGRHRRIVSLSA